MIVENTSKYRVRALHVEAETYAQANVNRSVGFLVLQTRGAEEKRAIWRPHNRPKIGAPSERRAPFVVS